MAAIDVGPGAIDRTSSKSVSGITNIDLGNPADGNGTLTSFEIWISSWQDGGNNNGRVLYWGTFYGGGTSWTSRSQSSDLNYAAPGSKQTFTGQNVSAQTNDVIGVYGSDDLCTISIDWYSVASGGWGWISGNQFGAGAKTYAVTANRAISLYATGATPAAGHPTAKRFGGVPFMRLNKGIWCL